MSGRLFGSWPARLVNFVISEAFFEVGAVRSCKLNVRIRKSRDIACAKGIYQQQSPLVNAAPLQRSYSLRAPPNPIPLPFRDCRRVALADLSAHLSQPASSFTRPTALISGPLRSVNAALSLCRFLLV
jgi:hypothetical protein